MANVRDDDEESLDFADESEWIDHDDDEPIERAPDLLQLYYCPDCLYLREICQCSVPAELRPTL